MGKLPFDSVPSDTVSLDYHLYLVLLPLFVNSREKKSLGDLDTRPGFGTTTIVQDTRPVKCNVSIESVKIPDDLEVIYEVVGLGPRKRTPKHYGQE